MFKTISEVAMKYIKFIFISLFTFLLISCGDSSNEIEFVQIFSDSNIHNEEDLKNLGIKNITVITDPFSLKHAEKSLGKRYPPSFSPPSRTNSKFVS